MQLLVNGITGHRGNSKRFPENSIAGFKSAIQCGVDFVELDIRYTRDRQLLVIHDPDTLALTGTPCRVAAATLQEVRQLTVRNRDGSPCGSLATLREVFQSLGPTCPVGISIQPKLNLDDGIQAIEETVALARELGMERLIAFNDGQLELMCHVKRNHPHIPVFLDTTEGREEDIRAALDYGFETIVNFKATTTPQWVERVLQAKLIPGVWNISTLEEYRTFRAMGIQRFYADNCEDILRCQNTLPDET